jgi:hypothetical protein
MEKQDHLDWNYSEFLAFLMIYASHVDMEFSENEKTRIKKKINEATFDKMFGEFDRRSDFESLQTILSYKGLYFPTADRKNELLNSVKMLFFADGDFSVMERELLHFLEKLM